MNRFIKFGLFCFWVCIHFSVLAKNSKDPVQTFVLDNGLKIVVVPDHRAPVAVSQVWYKVGSAYEPLGLTGISHVLEHMMFKGTNKYKPGEFSRIISENGGQENAFTNTDYTAYFQQVSVDRLPICFELEADRMQNLRLDNKEFLKELEVVKEERRMRVDDKPTSATYERFLAAAHIGSPYQHMPIGWMNDLNHLELGDLKRWYKKWYRPNNATLVVVGDVDPNAIHQLAKRYFGDIPSAPLDMLKPYRSPPGLGPREVEVEKPAQLPYLLLGYNVPSLKTAKEPRDVYTLELIAAMLNGDSGRLTKELVRGKHLAVSASAGYDLYSLFDTLFVVEGLLQPGKETLPLRKAFLEQLDRLKRGEIKDAELTQVKQQLIADKIFEQDSLFATSMRVGVLETVGLDHALADTYLKEIERIGVADIKRVANRYFQKALQTAARLKPQALTTQG